MRGVPRRAAATLLVPCLIAMGARQVVTAALTEIIVPEGPNSTANHDAVLASVGLLPRAPARIAVMDVSQGRAETRAYLLTLDAFIVKGNDVIYIVEQCKLLEGARKGSAIQRAILATVLWHEMAHLAGSNEHAARKAEEDLWVRFVRDGLVDQVTALRYLQILRKRPDDQLLAMK